MFSKSQNSAMFVTSGGLAIGLASGRAGAVDKLSRPAFRAAAPAVYTIRFGQPQRGKDETGDGVAACRRKSRLATPAVARRDSGARCAGREAAHGSGHVSADA